MSDMAKNNMLKTDPYEAHKQRYDTEKKNRDQSGGEITSVVVKGVSIPFWDLVKLLVSLAFACIPAAIILAIAWYVILAFFGGILGGIFK